MNNHKRSLFISLIVLLCTSLCMMNASQKNKEQETILNCLASNIRNSSGDVYDEIFVEIFNRENALMYIDAIFDSCGETDTLLTLAVKRNRLPIVNFLILQSVDLNKPSSKGTALVCAIKAFSETDTDVFLDYVEALVSAGAFLTHPEYIGSSKYPNPSDCFIYDADYVLNYIRLSESERKKCYDAITRGEKEYKERWKFYKQQVLQDIAVKLGIRDLANICVDYLAPGVTLAKIHAADIKEEHFVKDPETTTPTISSSISQEKTETKKSVCVIS